MMDTAVWQRSLYPLQLPSKGFALATPPAEEADPVVRLLRDTQSTHDSAQWHRSVTEDQYSTTSEHGNESNFSSHQATENNHADDGSSTAVSMSYRSPSPPSAHHGLQPSPGKEERSSSLIELVRHSQNQNNPEFGSWTRSAYPRAGTAGTETFPEQQSTSSASLSTEENEPEPVPTDTPSPDHNGPIHRTLRRTPRSRRIESPVQSVGEDRISLSAQRAGTEEGSATLGASPWKRKLYPATGAITEQPVPPATTGLATGTSLVQTEEKPNAVIPPNGQVEQAPSRDNPTLERKAETLTKTPLQHPQKSATRRQAYPLQAKASVAEFLDPQEPSSGNPTSESEAEILTKRPSQHFQKSATKRQAYPLQAMASVADFQDELTPPPSPDSNSKGFAGQKQVKSQAAGRSKTYPLQSPASIPNFSNLSAPAEKTPTEFAPFANKARDTELAAKVVQHWKRQVYPLQDKSPGSFPAMQRLPEDEEEKEPRLSQPVHLPKHVRAVKDSEETQHRGRTIVVLLDGTGDKFDNDNSNIVHLVSALKKDDPRQITYYQAGIGTYGAGGLSGGISAAMDMAVGSSLGLHVRDAYHFLMHTYKEGDKICIFSFSRGAYTARCLAGMIHKVGLLPPRNIQQISFAYQFYKNDTPEGWEQSFEFKKTFCMDVSIYFLGCFDSVASVGLIPRQLPLSSTPTNKSRYFRHAMALDERRAKFKVCRHQTKTWDQINKKRASPIAAAAKSAEAEVEELLPNYKSQDDVPPKYLQRRGTHNHPNLTNEEYEDIMRQEAPFETDVLEVWFAGAHADIGGGAVPNDERHKLAQIPLRWMIRQAFECNTGIIFRTAVLAEHGLDVHTLWPKYEKLGAPTHEPPPSFLEKFESGLPPRSVRRSKLVPIEKHENGENFYHLQHPTDEDWTPEQAEDFFDAMSPLNDQLVQVPNWWILEVIPVEYKVPGKPGEVSMRTGMNLGRYRGVEDVMPNVHWTALHRVKHLGYSINVRTAPHVEWVQVV